MTVEQSADGPRLFPLLGERVRVRGKGTLTDRNKLRCPRALPLRHEWPVQGAGVPAFRVAGVAGTVFKPAAAFALASASAFVIAVKIDHGVSPTTKNGLPF